MMVRFSWNTWLQLFARRPLSTKASHHRRVRLARVEGLEDRSLLTAPVAVNDNFIMDANTALSGSLLGNDFDADGDEITQAILGQNASNGSLSLAIDGTFTYTPTNGFVGTDQFTYLARDINGETSGNAAVVTIHVGTGNTAPVAFDDSFSTPVNTTLSGVVSGSDADGDPLTFVGGSIQSQHGFVTLFANGNFTYEPDPDYTGPDSFSYVANDGFTNSPEATISITVGSSGSNVAPVANDQSISTTVDTAFSGTLTASDEDEDALSFAIGAITPLNGEVTINPNGSFTYTPDPGFSGNDSFTFKANDGTEDSEEATVSIVVGDTSNSPPIVTDAIYATPTDTPITRTLDGTDPDGDSLTFSLGSTLPANGNLTLNPNGTFTYTPDAGFVGTEEFSFVASDGIATSAEGIVTIEVGIIVENNPPVADSQTVNTPINTTFSGNLTGSDADEDPLTFAIGDTQPAHGNVTINPNGSFSYTPDLNFVGVDTFTFRANDGIADSTEATIAINVGTTGNSVPVANSASINVSADTAFNGQLTGSDADGDPLTFAIGSLQPAHGTVSITSTGAFTYTPDAGYSGPDSFNFHVNDGTVNSFDATITVSVGSASNTAPVAQAATFNTAAGTPLTRTLTGTDADGDPLTFVAGTDPANGTVTIDPSGSFTYTPDAGFTGTDSFTFRVNDGTVNSASATVTINVGDSGPNTPPVAAPQTINTGADTPFSGTLIGNDADGDSLTFLLNSSPAHGTVSIAPSGTFTYTPDAGFTGSDAFSFRVNDGTVNSSAALVTINVGDPGSNTPPVASPQTVNVTADSSFTGSLSGSDADGDTLTFLAGSTPAHGTVTISSGGTFTYTPDAGFNGTDTFTFRVNDGTVNSSAATVTMRVGDVGSNTPPEGANQNINTLVNTSVSGTLTGTDAENDPLTFALGTADPLHGSVTIDPDGSFVYTPNAGFVGDDLFSFRVNDGTSESAEAVVMIHITATSNTPPVATPQTINTDVNTAFNGSLSGIDAEGDSLTFTAGSVSPQHGTIVVNSNGTFTYTPDSGFVGDDLFSFRVNDGTSNSTEALVVIHIGSTGANTAPTVINGTGTATAGATFNGSLSPLATDAEGDALTFVAVTQPDHGTLSLNPDGTFAYAPDSGFTGSDSFTFRANDSLLDSALATFTISVNSSGDGFTVDVSGVPGTIATSKKDVTPLDPTAELSNVDPTVNFNNATIRATITAGANSRDKLVVTDGSGGNGVVDVKGKRIFFNGTLVARITGGKRNQPLRVNFESNGSVDAVNAVLQRIGLRTTKNAGGGTRTVELQVNADGSVSTATVDANLV